MRIIFFICLMCMTPAMAWGNNDENRRDYVYGTGNSTGGSVNTYVDPQTGDVVTTVRPPKNSNNNQYNQQNVPIYIYPQVAPNWPPQPGPQPSPQPRP